MVMIGTRTSAYLKTALFCCYLIKLYFKLMKDGFILTWRKINFGIPILKIPLFQYVHTYVRVDVLS